MNMKISIMYLLWNLIVKIFLTHEVAIVIAIWGYDMQDEIKIFDVGTAEVKEDPNLPHTPSSIQADTLFTFTSDLEYLIPYIENACIYPRYCDEDINYLNIAELKKIYIPMKCFCDINLHRLGCHLDWYGYYGLAFSKEWGMNNGIQPVQYINPKSELCKDFSIAFSSAIKSDSSKTGSLENLMKSYMLHELMYYKPYEGNMRNRRSGKTERKCFTDECEWRFVPNLSGTEFEQVYYDNIIMNAGIINDVSNSLVSLPYISLKFQYDDLKYIIIKNTDDFIKLVEVIDKLKINVNTRNELISKIIIWDKTKGDF